MTNQFGGGANSLLERRFLLLKKEEVDNDMFDLVDTVEGVNNYGIIKVSFTAQDNSFYLVIPSDNYDDIMFAVSIINAKYAFMAMSNKITNGALCETNYRLSNNTVVISRGIATNEQKSISFNVYKMK